MPENLFWNLFHWARRQDENFVTEAFVFTLNHLLDHEPTIGKQLLSWLCFGSDERELFGASRPRIKLQVHDEDGTPDVTIIADDLVAIVEVKNRSGLGRLQLERYRNILDRADARTKRLVLLTHRPVEIAPHREHPDHHATWHQLAHWLKQHIPALTNPVSIFLVTQFPEFLEKRRMAIQKVEREYVTGMEAYLRLVSTIERALEFADIPVYRRPRCGRGFWVCYVGSGTQRLFCVRIRYKRPTEIAFEFVNFRHDPEKVRSSWQRIGKKPGRLFHLDSEFFELDGQAQMLLLSEFLKDAHSAAKQTGCDSAV